MTHAGAIIQPNQTQTIPQAPNVQAGAPNAADAAVELNLNVVPNLNALIYLGQQGQFIPNIPPQPSTSSLLRSLYGRRHLFVVDA
ncbi:hypothetical protein FRC11_002766 [Ceratobasidium sp. 423]|nr:hypothetical protein FRC11_002766 [Ceratobasidium sp. 423]